MPGSTIRVPVKEELLSAMKVAETSVEGAEYMSDRFTEILTKAKMLDSSRDVLKTVQEFVDLVKFRMLSSAQPWMGEAAASTDFKTMQRNIAKDATSKLRDLDPGDMHLDVAINDKGEFLQALSSEGKGLDSSKVEQAHKLLNAWFAENDVISKDSTLYECDENGSIKVKDQAAQQQTADKIRQLIDDPQKGFAKYLKDQGFSLTTQQHQYPDTKAEETKKVAAKEAIAAVSEQVNEAPDTQEPDSGIKSGI